MIKCHCAASIRGVAISPRRGAAYRPGLLVSVMSSQRFRRALAECRYTVEAVRRSATRSIVRCQYSLRVVAGEVRQPNPHLPAGRTPSMSAQIAQRLNGLDTDEAPSSCTRLVHTTFTLGGKTEDKQRFSADAGTITRQQQSGKGFMTSSWENLTLSKASRCLGVRTLASWRPYGGHDGSGGIQTQHSRTKGQHFFY
jgi:hypothetical protein